MARGNDNLYRRVGKILHFRYKDDDGLWRKARTEEPWKTFVSRKTGIDLRFLTRHQTELQPPKKGR